MFNNLHASSSQQVYNFLMLDLAQIQAGKKRSSDDVFYNNVRYRIYLKSQRVKGLKGLWYRLIRNKARQWKDVPYGIDGKPLDRMYYDEHGHCDEGHSASISLEGIEEINTYYENERLRINGPIYHDGDDC